MHPMYNSKASGLAVDTSSSLQFGGPHTNKSSLEMTSPAPAIDSCRHSIQKGIMPVAIPLPNGHFESWGDSGMADISPRTDTSTDVDTDEKNQMSRAGQHGTIASFDSFDRSKDKTGDQKTLRRLAQNREAARKSRLRKKAYVQQLESSRLKLTQLEQELQRARQQYDKQVNKFACSAPDIHKGALAFDLEYARWLDEHQRQINDLRAALNSHVVDNELRLLVDGVMAHYDELFRIKSIGAKADVFHMLSGMWTTPAERCFMWSGGFRSSELLKLLAGQLEPLTDQQLMGICNLQQSSQQAEDALSQGMEALQQSLAETVASGSLGPSGSGDVANYMGQMAIAMGKLGTLENFIRQAVFYCSQIEEYDAVKMAENKVADDCPTHTADLLRQQTLQQMHRILTIRQAARALLAISDYFSRLRALSSLWLARPRD
ncbi:Transcription factor tgal1 [Asimina triloba]